MFSSLIFIFIEEIWVLAEALEGKLDFPPHRDWLPEGYRWGLRGGEQSRVELQSVKGEFQLLLTYFWGWKWRGKYMPFIPPMLKPLLPSESNIWGLYSCLIFSYRAFMVAQTVNNLPAMQLTCVGPCFRKIPWRRGWIPTPVFLPGEFHGQKSLVGCSLWGHKGSDKTEWLNNIEYWLRSPERSQTQKFNWVTHPNQINRTSLDLKTALLDKLGLTT